jgi:5-methylcytosine-specific restriction endonuclease McrA
MRATNPTRRIVRNAAGWFSEGRLRKAEARRTRRCVECRTELGSGRSPYCGRTCQWRFQGHYFWDAARIYVMRRDRFTCQYCRTRHRARELEVDHIVEIARGGPSLDYENLQTLCRGCHRAKTRRFLRARARAPPVASPLPVVEEIGIGMDWFPA